MYCKPDDGHLRGPMFELLLVGLFCSVNRSFCYYMLVIKPFLHCDLMNYRIMIKIALVHEAQQCAIISRFVCQARHSSVLNLKPPPPRVRTSVTMRVRISLSLAVLSCARAWQSRARLSAPKEILKIQFPSIIYNTRTRLSASTKILKDLGTNEISKEESLQRKDLCQYIYTVEYMQPGALPKVPHFPGPAVTFFFCIAFNPQAPKIQSPVH